MNNGTTNLLRYGEWFRLNACSFIRLPTRIQTHTRHSCSHQYGNTTTDTPQTHAYVTFFERKHWSLSHFISHFISEVNISILSIVVWLLFFAAFERLNGNLIILYFNQICAKQQIISKLWPYFNQTLWTHRYNAKCSCWTCMETLMHDRLWNSVVCDRVYVLCIENHRMPLNIRLSVCA